MMHAIINLKMDLFINQDSSDKMSLALEIFVVYVRGAQRNIVQLNAMSNAALQSLKLDAVPMLMKTVVEVIDGKEVHTQH